MTAPRVVIGLSAVIVAVTEDSPLVAVTRDGQVSGLPFGPFDPAGDRTLELSLRGWVKEQTCPGRGSNSSRIIFTSSSWVWARVQLRRG